MYAGVETKVSYQHYCPLVLLHSDGFGSFLTSSQLITLQQSHKHHGISHSALQLMQPLNSSNRRLLLHTLTTDAVSLASPVKKNTTIYCCTR